jgi:hypothetical protein
MEFESLPYNCPIHGCDLSDAVKLEVGKKGILVLPGRYINKPETTEGRRRFGVTVTCPGTSKDPKVAAAPHAQRVQGVVSS